MVYKVGKGRGPWHTNRKTQGLNSGTALGTLALSGVVTNGLANSWSGLINGASAGSTITGNQTGLTVTSAARTYAWDGTGTAGTVSNGMVETLGALTANSPTVVLGNPTGHVKLSGRLFFTNLPVSAMVTYGLCLNKISSATASDGTTMSLGTNSLGGQTVTGTFAASGSKTITLVKSSTVTIGSAISSSSESVTLGLDGSSNPTATFTVSGSSQTRTLDLRTAYAPTSVISAASDDGTTLTVGTNSQGYPLLTGTYTTTGKKTVTITDSVNGTATTDIYVTAPPSPPSNAIATATATRINNSYNAKIPLTVPGSTATISVNTSNSTVNGRTIAAGGSTATTSVPDGSGVGGQTAQTVAAGAYIYADTSAGAITTGCLTWAPSVSKRWVFTGTTGTHFDFKISGGGAYGQIEVMVLWTDDADSATPTWFQASADPFIFKSVVSYLDVVFPSAPTGAGKRAVEVIFGQGVAVAGFNFEAGATIGPYTKAAELKTAAWNDSFDFGQSTVNQSLGLSVRQAAEYLGSHHAVSHGHRTNAWARIGGSVGKHGYVADRLSSNPWALDEVTRWGALDIGHFHMSINDNSLWLFTTNTAPTSIFNNAGGSNSFIQGPTTLYNNLVTAFWRARLAQPGMMIVVDLGFHDPTATPNSAILTACRNAFATAFDSDKLAVLLDFNAAQYRWMGSTYTISGMTAPFIAAGTAGTNTYFGGGSSAGGTRCNITYSITGTTLTVTAVNAGTVVPNLALGGTDGSTGTAQIKRQLTGTTGSTGTYQLTFAPGDVASTTSNWDGDYIHPVELGHATWGQWRGKAALFGAQKVLGLI